MRTGTSLEATALLVLWPLLERRQSTGRSPLIDLLLRLTAACSSTPWVRAALGRARIPALRGLQTALLGTTPASLLVPGPAAATLEPAVGRWTPAAMEAA